ncbi:MAG TPA: hypothetical protein VIP05_10685, partial [Burkholderiaceae bacterium]
LQAEDAPTMAPRACELEGAQAHWRDGAGHARQSYLQLGCGIGGGTEIALQAFKPRELGLNGKTQFFSTAWGEGEAQLSLAWSLNHRRMETAWRRSGAGLILVASAPLSRDWTVHANLGHARDELQRRRSTTWALAAEHNGLGEAGRWQPMGEVFGDDHGRPWANAALRVALMPDRVFVDASLGRQLSGAKARLATAGFRLAF